MVGRTEIRYAGVSKTMDIPKKIEKLINQRCRYADVFGGSEVYLNPIGSANRIRKEILGK